MFFPIFEASIPFERCLCPCIITQSEPNTDITAPGSLCSSYVSPENYSPFFLPPKESAIPTRMPGNMKVKNKPKYCIMLNSFLLYRIIVSYSETQSFPYFVSFSEISLQFSLRLHYNIFIGNFQYIFMYCYAYF